jgi:hypothetical protein
MVSKWVSLTNVPEDTEPSSRKATGVPPWSSTLMWPVPLTGSSLVFSANMPAAALPSERVVTTV